MSEIIGIRWNAQLPPSPGGRVSTFLGIDYSSSAEILPKGDVIINFDIGFVYKQK